MRFSILTIFPELVRSPLEAGIIRRAREAGKISIAVCNIRDFAFDKQSTTDDRPFGGGEGMVMKPEPLARAVSHVSEGDVDPPRVLLLSPQGTPFTQEIAGRLSRERHLALVCGRYEGVDERFRRHYVTDELSIGDYVLSGGELAALVVVDAVTRLLPGVLGCSRSAENETFSRSLLKHPQYTRPRIFEDVGVPEELLSGDHERIRIYRFIESVKRTAVRRPDLLERAVFSEAEKQVLRQHGLDCRLDSEKPEDE